MQQIGILTREHKEDVYGLFGQQQHPHSSQYEYYYEPSKDGGGRVPLCVPQGRQLWTGDNVALADGKGVWKVTLFVPRVNFSY
jgi:hypothetical protein